MCRSIALFGIVSLSAWAQSGPLREVSSPALTAHGSIPVFYNGYLYSAAGLGRHESMTLFAPDGHVVATLVPSKSEASVGSIAIDSDGTLAVSWAGLTSRGIDIRDPYGSLIRTIDTGGFVARHLSFGGDHSLWVTGWQRDADKPGIPPGTPAKDYVILRKYSIEGIETGEYLKRSLFKPGLEPGNLGWQMQGITVTGDRVGVELFSGKSSDQREWIELDLNGHVTGRWTLDPHDLQTLPGVVLTSDNQAYVQRVDQAAKRYQLFRLNRALSSWEPVEAPNAELYGLGGRELVFRRSEGGVMHMSWYPQPAEVSR